MMKLTKKTKFALAAAILLVCGLLFCGLYLRAHAAYTPSGALRSPTTEHPRVALAGSGYEVNDAKATPLKNTNSLFIKKVVKKKTAPKPKKKTTTVKKPQPKPKKTTSARKKPSSKTREINENARSERSIQISTDIPENVKESQKTLEFTVTAKTASGKSIPFPAIKLTSPKKFKRIRSGNSNDKYIAKFSIDLDVGTNTIKIKATDEKTKTSSTLTKTVYRSKKYPYIETSLEDGMKTSKSYIDFTVKAADENGKPVTGYLSGSVIDDSDITPETRSIDITAPIGDRERDAYEGEYFGNSKYRVELEHGENVITIRIAKDADEDSPILEIKKTIYCTSKPTGTVTVGIEAKTLSLGKLAPDKKINIYPNDSINNIGKRYLESSGFSTTLGFESGYFYTESIRKKT